MKFISDKIKNDPKHALTIAEIKFILKLLPQDWYGKTYVFQLSSQLFDEISWSRPVVKNNTTFKIHSRGFIKKQIIKELLIELAIIPNKFFDVNEHQLSNEQRRKLELIVKPFYDKILIELEN